MRGMVTEVSGSDSHPKEQLPAAARGGAAAHAKCAAGRSDDAFLV